MEGISQRCTRINGGDIFNKSPSRMTHKSRDNNPTGWPAACARFTAVSLYAYDWVHTVAEAGITGRGLLPPVLPPPFLLLSLLSSSSPSSSPLISMEFMG